MEEPLRKLLLFVRTQSPFYAELYKEMEILETTTLQDFPIVPHAAYWAANRAHGNTLRTGPLVDGVIFNTGGTTSQPKATAYSQTELESTATQLGNGLVAAGLMPGDHVANLFYAGELWGSFMLHVLSILATPVPALHLPISGPAEPSSYAALLEEFDATAILSTVTSLVRLANFLLPKGKTLPKVHAIMFGGEGLYPEQRTLLKELCPNASIRSCILGSMDAGVFAESAGFDDARVHRVLSPSVVLELVTSDEDEGQEGEVILENNRPGDIVVTSLIRRLTPVVRYPVGDRAEWLDRRAGLFRLLGRSNSSVRLGPVSLDMNEVRRCVEKAVIPAAMAVLQAVLSHENGRDTLECKIVLKPIPGTPPRSLQGAAGAGSDLTLAARVRETLFHERPMLREHIDLGLIGDVRIGFCDLEHLHVNHRSGKLMLVVDERHLVRGGTMRAVH